MLIMSLDEERAAAVLRHMSENSLGKLRRAAESLDVAKISDEEKQQTLQTFFVRQRKGGVMFGDPDERFRRALAKAKGEEKVKELYEDRPNEETPEEQAEEPVAYIAGLPVEQIVGALGKESARCGAVLLAHLSGETAGKVLNRLDEGLREAIVERIIRSDVVAPAIVDEVVAGFKARLEALAAEAEVASEEKRARELASMIGTLDRQSQERVLAQISDRDPELAESVERAMFGFEDLTKVASRSMQELLRTAEVSHVALALKGAPEDIAQHFMTNMSERVRERVEEERQMTGRVPLSQVEEAREEVMKLARKLYREGNLVVEIGDEQYVE